jgi:hypothetical protein
VPATGLPETGPFSASIECLLFHTLAV